MSDKVKLIAFGSDPEGIIHDSDNNPVSAVGLVPGTKYSPHPIDEKGNYIQTDNVMVEYCLPPTKNPKELHDNMLFCMKWTRDNLPQGHQVKLIASEIYPDNQLQTDQAKEFGCEPDYNAWNNSEENTKPSAENKNLRTCGGHLHVSYDNPTKEMNEKFVQMLDLYLAIPFLLLDPDDRRRELYGKAGAYRPKVYGFEYRVLSNYWLSSEELIKYVFDQVEFVNSQANWGIFNPYYTREIQLAINNNNKEKAAKLISWFKIPTLKLIEIEK